MATPTTTRGTTNAWPWADAAEDGATLILLGDTNVQERDDPASAFRHVLPTLDGADVVFGQLEGPLSPPSQNPLAPDIPHKERWRHSDPRMVEGLVAAGFDAVSCASNVTYGPKAIKTSLETLDGAGIAHCGAGLDYAEARRPAIVEKAGVRFGFLSYTSVFWIVGHAAGPDTPGVATVKIHTGYEPGRRALEMPGAPPEVITVPDEAELAAMVEDVRALRQEVDVLVCSFHWGISSSEETVSYQRVVGRAAVDAGADVVIGHHPHKVQAVELHRGRPIFYSMGNFAFDWEKMRGRNLDGLLVRCVIRDKNLSGVCVVPARRNEENDVELLDPSGSEGRRIVERLRELSAGYGTEPRLRGSEVVLDGVAAR